MKVAKTSKSRPVSIAADRFSKVPHIKKTPPITEHLAPDTTGTESAGVELEKLLASVAFVLNYLGERGGEVGSAFLMSVSDVLLEGAKHARGLFDINDVATLGIPYDQATEFLRQRCD